MMFVYSHIVFRVKW